MKMIWNQIEKLISRQIVGRGAFMPPAEVDNEEYCCYGIKRSRNIFE